MDAKFFCSNDKNDMIFLSKIYDYIEDYHIIDNKPICHHRLFYHHLEKLNKKFDMIKVTDESHGGWFYIRNNELKTN